MIIFDLEDAVGEGDRETAEHVFAPLFRVADLAGGLSAFGSMTPQAKPDAKICKKCSKRVLTWWFVPR